MNKPIIYEAEASVLATSTPVLVEVAIEWNRARIEERIRKVFPEDTVVAVAIAKAESGLRATSTNPEAHKNRRGEVICYGSFGIMQIGCVHSIKDSEGLYDVEYNLQKARAIYDDSLRRTGNGWLPWGAYTDGRYKQYL